MQKKYWQGSPKLKNNFNSIRNNFVSRLLNFFQVVPLSIQQPLVHAWHNKSEKPFIYRKCKYDLIYQIRKLERLIIYLLSRILYFITI